MCKKFMFLIFLVPVLGLVSSVSAVEFKVDVGCPDQESAGNLKEGWVAFNGTVCSGATGPVTVTNIGGSGIDVAITIGNTSDNAYRSPGEYTGDELGRDYVSADDSISQADCTITMTLSNLPAAGYTLTTYHNCPDQPDPKPAIDITVSGSGVVGVPTNATEVAQTVLNTDVAFDDIGKGTVQFVADGAGEVVVTFVAREEAHKWRVYLNGFELSGASLVPMIQFESEASGDLESVSPAELTVLLRSPEEGQTYTVDYAAVGGTATAGADYVIAGGGPACWGSPTQCHGDTDNDGEVKGSDFLALKNSWYKSDPEPGYDACADFDRDGCVKGSDFLILKNNWYQAIEANCPPEGGSATLVFAPGETLKNISIEIIDDGLELEEEDETVIVELSNPTGPNVELGGIAQHTYTILDPRPKVSFATATSSGSEGATVANVEVRLSPASSKTVTVDYAVTDGTATRDVDYILGDGTLTFDPGEVSKNISINIIDDEIEEYLDETIELTLSNPTNATVGLTPQHTFTILDNELTPGLIGFASVSASGLNGTTGGAGGPTVTVTNSSDFLDYISRDGPYIIQLSGTISLSGMNKVKSDKTIIGLGSDAVITGGGLNLSEVSNVIIQNITFTNASDDSINLQTYTHHVWIDHCDFSNGYDGLIDIKRGTDYVTVSWNHFYSHDKTMLLGHSDDNGDQDIGHLKVTYHHNWFDGTSGRHPRVRFGKAHVFNNYYLNNSGYGVASTCDADVVVESNYFQNVPSPTLVGYGSSWDGDLVERNNIFANSGRPETRGSAFEPSSYYSYTCDSAFDIPARVKNGAGVGKL